MGVEEARQTAGFVVRRQTGRDGAQKRLTVHTPIHGRRGESVSETAIPGPLCETNIGLQRPPAGGIMSRDANAHSRLMPHFSVGLHLR